MSAYQQQNYTVATSKAVLFSKLYKSSTADETAAKRIDEMVGERTLSLQERTKASLIEVRSCNLSSR